MSNSYKTAPERDKRPPSRFMTPQEEYDIGLRRRPRNVNDWADEDELESTDDVVVDVEEE